VYVLSRHPIRGAAVKLRNAADKDIPAATVEDLPIPS